VPNRLRWWRIAQLVFVVWFAARAVGALNSGAWGYALFYIALSLSAVASFVFLGRGGEGVVRRNPKSSTRKG
jgi:hypothetical protein